MLRECILVGCVPSAAVAVCPGVSAWGVSAHGGVSAQERVCLARRGCLLGGVHSPGYNEQFLLSEKNISVKKFIYNKYRIQRHIFVNKVTRLSGTQCRKQSHALPQ